MRLAKPWLRSSTGTWHVWLNGKQVYLGKDEDKAHAKYRKLIQSDVAQDLTVRQVIERYWNSQKRKAESTKKRRKPILESFSDFVPASLKAEALKPYHLDRWLEDRGKRKVSVKGAGRGKKAQTTKPLSETTERDYITLIAGVFKWAKAKGYVSQNPLAEVEKPAANTRQEFVKFEDWSTLINFAIGEPFKEYITVMLYTGARATEMLKFEALHFDKNRLVLPMKSSKGKKRSRVVYLPDAALGIVKRDLAPSKEPTLGARIHAVDLHPNLDPVGMLGIGLLR